MNSFFSDKAAEQSEAAATPLRYTVVSGFNFGAADTRVDEGALTVTLPPDVLQQLLDVGAITEEKA